MNVDETSFFKKLIFAAPRFGTSLILGIESFATFSLYYLGYGVSSLQVGIALALGYVSIALGQFLLGWLSDFKYTRWGRRKPYIFFFSPLLVLAFIFLMLPNLFLPDSATTGSYFNWLLVWDVLFRFSYAVTTPYQAWMAELFPVKERPQVSQMQNILGYVGTGSMGIFTFLFFSDIALLNKTNTFFTIYVNSILILGIIVLIVFYLVLLLLPTEMNHPITSPVENVKNMFKNKNYLRVIFMHGSSGIVWAILSSSILTYSQLVLGLEQIEYLLIGGILGLFIFLFLHYWRKRIEQIGKKRNLLSIFLLAVLLLPITIFGLFEAIPRLVLGISFIVSIGIILGGWYLFPYIIYADIAQDDERNTGSLKAGTFTGFPFLTLNLFQALGAVALGLLTSLPTVVINSKTFSIGMVLWGPFCSIILLLLFFYIKNKVILDFEWEKSR